MKVLLLTKYDKSGASSRYRTLQYLEYLKNQGINVKVSSLLGGDYVNKIYAKQKVSFFYYLKQYTKRAVLLILKKNKFDLCWVEGELFPYMPFWIEKFFLPKKYVAEYDDAIFHNYNMHRTSLVKKLLGTKIDNVMKNSLHTVVGNEYVKQYALLAQAKKITILPTVVDANAYKPVSPPAERTSKVTIGWLGSPTTVKYLEIIQSVLIAVAKKSNVRLLIIGGEYKIDGIETVSHHWPDKWSEVEEISLLNQIDIGIMPLIDSPWEKGKCGFKLIKYMACAKPVIASPVSMNQEIVHHGINGYLAETLQEWEDYLLALISDATQREQFGMEGRNCMVQKYSLQTTAPIMRRILSCVE